MHLDEAPQELKEAAFKAVRYLQEEVCLQICDNDAEIQKWLILSDCAENPPPPGMKQGQHLLFAHAERDGIRAMLIVVKYFGFEDPTDNGYVGAIMDARRVQPLFLKIGPKTWATLIHCVLMVMGADPQKINWDGVKLAKSIFKHAKTN